MATTRSPTPTPTYTVFTIPPSSVPSIGDTLSAANISWKYYGDQWNNYVPDPYQLNYGAPGADRGRVLQHLQSVPVRHVHHGQPAMCPSPRTSRTPRTSTPTSERHAARGFVRQAERPRGRPSIVLEARSVRRLHARRSSTRCRPIRSLWNDTAIFITFDEGGGYYDSGYVQPLDFFGDGTRIPLIVVSPYTQAGSHLARLLRSRFDPQIHREELEAGHGDQPQPR